MRGGKCHAENKRHAARVYGAGGVTESASFGSGSNKVEALVARLIAATLSRSASALLAPCNNFCARISR